MARDHRRGSDSFRALIGKPGVVYVLSNDGLRHGWFKIGCSTRSGQARAFDLNNDANTGTPGAFRCIYQQRTLDCGTAEQEVFARLRQHRRGKWGQEFFEVELTLAKSTIELVCSEVDKWQGLPASNSPLSTDQQPAAPNTGVPAEPRLASQLPLTSPSTLAERSRPIRLRWVLGVGVVAVLVWLTFGPGAKSPSPIYGKPASTTSPTSTKSKARERSNEPVNVKSSDDSKHATQQASSTGVPARNNAEKALHSIAPGVTTDSGDGSTSGTNELSGTPVESSSISSDSRTKARDVNPTGLNRVEPAPVDSTCSSERFMQDPIAYNRCLSNQRP